MQLIQRILCPTDFSANAARALEYAEHLAREADAELYLVHAFERPVNFSISGQEHPRDQRIQSELDAVLATSSHQKKIHRKQHAGSPGEVICWMAQDNHCNLIIMGTHGRTGLNHILFGSVAEYVLRHARCPVLTIREPHGNEPMLTRPSVMPILAPRYM